MPGKVSITVGLPGSGKTTVAKLMHEDNPDDVILVSRDGLRAELFNGEGILSPHEENYITKVQKGIVKDALRADKHVIIHDMHLREKYRTQWAKIARNHGAEFEIIDLTSVPLNDCLNNDYDRSTQGGRRVGSQVIQDLHTKFIKPLQGQPVKAPEIDVQPVSFVPWVRTPGLPDCIIVDIDGTVADGKGVRNMYDATMYHLDRPKQDVIRIVQDEAYKLGTQILFVSGRHEDYRDVTEEWLFQHVKVPFKLFMRKDHQRDDSVEKYLLFDEYIRGNWNPKYVLDDRDRVVDMWRFIKLLTLQVDRGDF